MIVVIVQVRMCYSETSLRFYSYYVARSYGDMSMLQAIEQTLIVVDEVKANILLEILVSRTFKLLQDNAFVNLYVMYF